MMSAYCPSFSPPVSVVQADHRSLSSIAPVKLRAPWYTTSFHRPVVQMPTRRRHPIRRQPTQQQSTRQQPTRQQPSRRRPTATIKTPNSPQIKTSSPSKETYRVHDWNFKSLTVQYATAGVDDTDDASLQKAAIVLVHGFGANCQHWRRNMGPLAERGFRIYALDLLGFGMGDKPTPGTLDGDNNPVQYTFDYWTSELAAFIDDVVETRAQQRPVFLVANSIGCMVTMQYAVEYANRVAALAFISPSLRQLNVRKRSWVQDVTAPLLMQALANRPIGAFFLDSIAKPDVLRSVLEGAYAVREAVDDELVAILREPAQTTGALDVFLSFISYDTGPIPEDFLPRLTQPALVMWGECDQFEPFELGQKLRHYSVVENFVPLPGVGHCAHDELPERVNDLISGFVTRHLRKADLP